MNSNEVFNIPGDLPRRLTRNNTKETRENWFKGFDATKKRELERQLPNIPIEPIDPGTARVQEIEFPKILLIFSALLLLCLILTGIKGWLVLSHLGPAAFLIISQMRTTTPNLRFLEAIRSLFGYLATGTALLTIVFFLYLEVGDGPKGIPISVDLLAIGVILASKLHPWLLEKNEVKLSNERHRMAVERFKRDTWSRQTALSTRKQIQERIDSIAIDCLHYEEMVRIRRELFDKILVDAFADLGVTEEVQREILSDRERHILEISGPLQFGNSEYSRPIVEFKPGVLPRHPKDAPILADYLAHLYSCTLAIILPQGLGTYDVVIDSVNLHHRTLGNQLTMWKSISRVNRENSREDGPKSWSEETIVLETYGGTKTHLEINGISIKENRELIPVVDSSQEPGLVQRKIDMPKGRMVNSFVLAIQQKMTEEKP